MRTAVLTLVARSSHELASFSATNASPSSFSFYNWHGLHSLGFLHFPKNARFCCIAAAMADVTKGFFGFTSLINFDGTYLFTTLMKVDVQVEVAESTSGALYEVLQSVTAKLLFNAFESVFS